jgi:pyruvate/2-oxoglutarate/acetoin dehydrogenase E1 component
MTTVLDSLNSALCKALAANKNVFILGEDILDPYGGAFKVTSGLSTTYPNQVFTTPISEAGIVGLATGMAMRGIRPVVEIMFGDFITLITDQLINHTTKVRWMYNNLVNVPLVIRTPMGGRRGYGPTHSQTLEKHFMGIPGLRVLAPCTFGNPGELLLLAILHGEDPTLFIENKLLYPLTIHNKEIEHDFNIKVLHSSIDLETSKDTKLKSSEFLTPTYNLSLKGAPRVDITIAAYGYMAELAFQAALQLAYEHEIFSELIIPTQLTPLDPQPLLDSINKSEHLLVIEEGTHFLGWGAEIVAQSCEAPGINLRMAKRLTSPDLPIPASATLENAQLPDTDAIVLAAVNMEHQK